MPHSLLPQIGRTIATIGSNQFTIALHGLIAAKLSVDAIHFQSEATLPSAIESAQSLDDVITSNCGESAADDASKLCLEETTENFRHRIVLLRKAPMFSEQESTQLKHLAPLLFSLLEQHLQAHRRRVDVSTSIEYRFRERLRETGMKLSEREQQVCLGLLAGHTVPQQAEQLTLTVNTVGSYMRRATAKLGISGRNALMRWLYDSPEDMASAN
ncbi:DNA-binding CsgD family transcriptional regulator [Pseudomonas sp. BIGb0408]|uniref:DNA-binding CsgD family transcriptional regulator n=1 Tax=Phytopseudomonas flavescens TaxID=29435 RepID=A0A7Y9XMY4_9GAMM|nr:MULTISPECIES: helix-turn-helix transcriptional regulator [Pseudomonas]MCW2292445.1 DNA-binding CsgD family transcriptional regulator [Pseudomonas sp. BIGb0408]NYH72984.1 DNA-binding CsgD family transcriptional regulator [Pseudomonas flavescens]